MLTPVFASLYSAPFILGSLFEKATNGSSLLNFSDEISEAVSDSWNQSWQLVLSGGLYATLSAIGSLIAIVCLAFWGLQFAKKMIHHEGSAIGLEEIAFPIIVVILLSNHGMFMANVSWTIRSVVNHYNSEVLQVVAKDVDFQKTLSQLSDYSTVLNQVQASRQQCNTVLSQGNADSGQDKLKQCLELSNQTAKELVNLYAQQHPGADRWTAKLEEIGDAITASPLQGIASVTAAGINGILNFGIIPMIEGVLVAFQAACQQLIELSMLLTALIAPIAVGASLLPIGAKPLYAWFTGFCSLGMLKMAFNICLGLAAMSIAQTGPNATDTLINAIFMCVLCPILAFGLAAGGGIAIFNGITSAASAAASAGSGMATTFLTK